jgi:hypothetical protein
VSVSSTAPRCANASRPRRSIRTRTNPTNETFANQVSEEIQPISDALA